MIPEWLEKALETARKEGRILRDTGCNAEALAGATTSSAAPTELQRLSIEGVRNESEFQQWVIDRAREAGWMVAHCRRVKIIRDNGEAYWETPLAVDGTGFPDLIMARAVGGVGELVIPELKFGKNKTTPAQDVWLSILKLCGLKFCGVWYPKDWEQILEVLR